jgi:hypothetical protein
MSKYINYDVVVIGGGPAGTAAAIASSRMGVKTLLVEQFGFLGGMATAGLVIPHFEAHRCGISLEIIERLKEVGGWGSKNWDNTFDPEMWKFVTEQIALESGVKILYHCKFSNLEMRNSSIQYIIVSSKKGPILIKAKTYIDSTGDGDVAYLAGVPYEFGRPQDGKAQPLTMMFMLDNVSYLQENEKQLYEDIILAKKKFGSKYNLPYNRPWIVNLPFEGQVVVQLSHIYDIDATDPWKLTYAEIEGRKQAFESWRFLKKYIKGFENSNLISTASHIGVRETRHFIGEYILNLKDITTPVKFKDVIARCGFPIDIHEPTSGVQRNIPLKQEFEIPYRVLIPKNCLNLLLSGRNISGTYEAFASYRVKGIAMATGQAAGIAAALSKLNNTDIRSVKITELQDILQKNMVNIGRKGDINKKTYRNFPKTCSLGGE